jgi:polysulfide reductase chain C
MEKVWGLPVALDLFLAGLGAGSFLVAVIAEWVGEDKYKKITQVGAMIAPFPVIIGILLLIANLGQPGRVLNFLRFNLKSTMSIGAAVLGIFVILSLVYLALGKKENGLKKLVRGVGVPISLLVVAYPGVLLATTPNPVWESVFLPVIFVGSAFSTGLALCILLLGLGREKTDSAMNKLQRINGGVLLFQLLAIVIFILTGGGNLGVILSGSLAFLWWVVVLVLGVVVPLVVGLKSKVGASSGLANLMAFLVLLGGFFLRYVILIGGQM